MSSTVATKCGGMFGGAFAIEFRRMLFPIPVPKEEDDELGLRVCCVALARSVRLRSRAADDGSPKYVACDADS